MLVRKRNWFIEEGQRAGKGFIMKSRSTAARLAEAPQRTERADSGGGPFANRSARDVVSECLPMENFLEE